jgi:DnaJ-domain-containing protein 1
MYDRLGDILRDRLDSDEDPFDAWEPGEGKPRRAGNATERTPPPVKAKHPERIQVPTELVPDFRILGLLPGVSPEECKAAWKRLMKAHHPDRHVQDPLETERATRASVTITDAYRRITRWYTTGSL